MTKPIPSHDEVRSAFENGSIIHATKEQLELFLVANGQARILHEANQARASEMGETMRQLLAARQSQELHSEALRISRVALWVSVFAFVVGLAGAGAAFWPIFHPSPTEIYSREAVPVRVENAVQLQPQPSQVPTSKPSSSRGKN